MVDSTPGRFAGKTAVVTGAAGGIGRAACARFATDGAQVVAVDLAGSALDETVAAVSNAGGECLAVEADVTDGGSVAGYVEAAMNRFGRIDAFFNNAGVEGVRAPLWELGDEDFDRVIAVNLRGVFLGLKHVAPAMRAGGGGAIVNTASIAGLTATPGIIAYGASKHAVVGMTKSAAAELAPEIRVNAVCPGPIETRMMRSLERQFDPDNPEAVHDMFAQGIPLGRYGEPEEVAALVAWLCSGDSEYISGAMHTIDGGGGGGRRG